MPPSSWPNVTAQTADNPAANPAPISVVIPGPLQPFAGDAPVLEVDVEGPVSVRELLDVMGHEYRVFNRRIRDERGVVRRYVNLYVAGQDVRQLGGLDAMVQPGDEVLIIASVAGG